MNKKKLWMGVGALAILGGGAFYAAPAIQENMTLQSETIKMDDFKELKEAQFEVLDTAAFTDKNLEKWFEENKESKGEHLYFDNKHTYVLISPGKDAKGDTTIWFDGLKTSGKEKLVVGYDLMSAKELGIAVKEDELRTLLVRTEGEFKEVKSVSVEKEEVKVAPAETTEASETTEPVETPAEEADKDAEKASDEKDEKASDKEDAEKEDKASDKKASEKDKE